VDDCLLILMLILLFMLFCFIPLLHYI
jgi:hypothetical protein